jgi:hypothetical protein
MRRFWLAGAALLMASGAQAGEADELGCMEKSYSAEQSADIDELLPEIDLLAGGDSPQMNAMGMLVGTAASTCAATLEWTDAEFEPAILFELGRLMEQAMRRHGPLAGEEIAVIDAALIKGDRTALWAALEEQVMIGMGGEPNQISDTNTTLFGAFLLEIGIGFDEAKAEQIGAFLATKAMQRASKRTFATQ